MGRAYIIPPTMEIENMYLLSSKTTPLIFLLTSGTDPREYFLRFAEDNLMSKRLQIISLGQGMGPKAEIKIRQAQKKGEWILLENCHLASSWMSDLDRISHEIDKNSHRDFRLWLTSMSTSSFALSVL
jgi:dynein heavy chain, axonemal